MVACLMTGIFINVVQIVLEEWWQYKIQGSILLPFYFFTTELCRKEGVEDYPTDLWVKPSTRITLLKIKGEGAPGKKKFTQTSQQLVSLNLIGHQPLGLWMTQVLIPGPSQSCQQVCLRDRGIHLLGVINMCPLEIIRNTRRNKRHRVLQQPTYRELIHLWLHLIRTSRLHMRRYLREIRIEIKFSTKYRMG